MYEDNFEIGHLVHEGPIEMSQEELDAYRQIKGDEKATVTTSRDVSEKQFGNGGTVFVSVTLTTDQSTQGLESGYAWAAHFATKKVWEAHTELTKQLKEKGILKDG